MKDPVGKLKSLGPVEQLAMEFAACLPPNCVPIEWVHKLVVSSLADLPESPGHSLAWAKHVLRLDQARLLLCAKNGHPSIFLVPASVADALTASMTKPVRMAREQAIALFIRNRIDTAKATGEVVPAWEWHAFEAMAAFWSSKATEELAMLLTSLTYYYLQEQRKDVARTFAKRAVAVDQTRFGDQSVAFASSLLWMADIEAEIGNFQAATELAHRAQGIQEAALGAVHGLVLETLCFRIALLRSNQQADEAEALMDQATALGAELEAARNPQDVDSLMRLAEVLHSAGRLSETEALCRRAIEVLGETVGENDPQVGVIVRNLSTVLADLNRVEEAAGLAKIALTIDEAAHGESSPPVARDLSKLTVFLQQAGKPEEALAAALRLVSILEELHGTHSSEVLPARRQLIGLYSELGRAEEALAAAQQVVSLAEKSCGRKGMVDDLAALAKLLQTQGRASDAEATARRAVALVVEVWGFTRVPSDGEDPVFDLYSDILRGRGRTEEQIQDSKKLLVGKGQLAAGVADSKASTSRHHEYWDHKEGKWRSTNPDASSDSNDQTLRLLLFFLIGLMSVVRACSSSNMPPHR